MPDVAILLADVAWRAQNPNNFGDTRSGGLAGPIGLFIILMLALATVLLIRNMNRRLRRLPESFSPQTDSAESRDAAEQDAAGRGTAGRSDTTAEGP